jgi:hypothetical protein
MKIPRLLAFVALSATLSAPVVAQSATTGFHTVACIKVKPENAGEYRKWISEDVHKYAQSRVDAGAVSTWIVLRAVIPAGTSAECDYLFVSMYPGIPPQPMGLEEMEAALKKAGLTMTAQQFVDRRTGLTTLISNNMYQNQGFVGSFKKGDYFVVNQMKAANLQDYVAWERKVWMPIAEQMAKDGTRSGWSVNTQVFPGGMDVKYNAVTVDVYSTWDSIYKSDFAQMSALWRKVHPDMEFGTSFEQYDKLRRQGDINVYVVQDTIAKK